jgi:hypothetical protein
MTLSLQKLENFRDNAPRLKRDRLIAIPPAYHHKSRRTKMFPHHSFLLAGLNHIAEQHTLKGFFGDGFARMTNQSN